MVNAVLTRSISSTALLLAPHYPHVFFGHASLTSPRSVRVVAAWTEAAGISEGPLFWRVQIRRYKARRAVPGRRIDSISGRETWDLRKDPAEERHACPHRI